MSTKRILVQAVAGGLLFWVFKLILEKSLAQETLIREGQYALVFAVIYGVYLALRNRFGKRPGEKE
jgi:hypothetical protein